MGKFCIIKKGEQKTSSWSGGTTTEIFIFPESSSYAARNFDFRISSATIEVSESDFTKLDGVTRHLMILNGAIELCHDGENKITLKPYAEYIFDGGRNTKSFGICTDFNLMLRNGYSGNLKAVQGTEQLRMIYALTSDTIIKNSEFEIILDSGDFVIFNDDQEVEINKNAIAIDVKLSHSGGKE